VVEELVKVGADVNLQGVWGNTPLIAACKGGHVSVVKELVKAGADVNLQDDDRDTPLITAVRECSLSAVKCLVEHGADLVTQVVDIKVSAVYRALFLNKPDIVKYLIQQQNKISPGQYTGNVHLFNCLVDIRHARVTTDSRDDVVVTDRSVWGMDLRGDVWRTISGGDCDVLRHLLCVGLDVNQSVQLYSSNSDDGDCESDVSEDEDDNVRPLLCRLIEEEYVIDRRERVRMLLEAGADVNVRVRYREYDSVLDRDGVSVLERTRPLEFQYSDSDSDSESDKGILCEMKHVRRHSL
jgi:hypothetical protein